MNVLPHSNQNTELRSSNNDQLNDLNQLLVTIVKDAAEEARQILSLSNALEKQALVEGVDRFVAILNRLQNALSPSIVVSGGNVKEVVVKEIQTINKIMASSSG